VASIMYAAHSVDQAVAFCGITAEAICVACFLLTGATRELPAVFAYLCYNLFAEVAGYAIYAHGNGDSYWVYYVVCAIIGYGVELGVGWELATKIIAPKSPEGRKKVRRGVWQAFIIFAFIAAAVASGTSYRHVEKGVGLFFKCELGFAIFRALMFAGILIATHVWSIDRYDRRAYILVNLAAYSLFALLAEIAHELAAVMADQYGTYLWVERLRSSVWCGCMLILSWQIALYQERRQVRACCRAQRSPRSLHIGAGGTPDIRDP